MQDAHGGLAVLDEAHAAVAAPLVLHRHAADLHHHVPQLLGRAPALLGPRQLFAGGGQELAQLQRRRLYSDWFRVSSSEEAEQRVP